MESRCYDGTIRVLTEDYPAKRSEILQIAGFELFLFVVTIIRSVWR
jgi:cobalt/nickel transport system permease protein